MMDSKKKKLAAILIESMPHESEGSDFSESGKSDKEIAAEEVLSAIKEADVPAFEEALSSFIQLCLMDYEDKEESEGDHEVTDGKSKFEY